MAQLDQLMEYDFDNHVKTSSNQLTTNILKFVIIEMRRQVSNQALEFSKLSE